MILLVQHDITNKEKFMSITTAGAPPSDTFKVIAFLPAVSQPTATCIWEAPDAASLKNFLEPILGDSSKNTYIEVDSKLAMLPGAVKEAAAIM